MKAFDKFECTPATLGLLPKEVELSQRNKVGQDNRIDEILIENRNDEIPNENRIEEFPKGIKEDKNNKVRKLNKNLNIN